MKTDTGLGEAVIQFRWWIILATLLMVAGSGYGILNIGFTNNYRVFFSEENPQLQAFDSKGPNDHPELQRTKSATQLNPEIHQVGDTFLVGLQVIGHQGKGFPQGIHIPHQQH